MLPALAMAAASGCKPHPLPATSRTFPCHFPLTLPGRPCYNPPTPGRTLTTVCPRSTPRHPPPSTVNHPERPPTDSQEKKFSQTTVNQTAAPSDAHTPLPTSPPPPPADRTTAFVGRRSERHHPYLVTAAGVRLSLRGDCRNRRRDAVTARSLMLYWPVRYLSRCWQLRLVITQLRWRWA
jgi:hypothetical protein